MSVSLTITNLDDETFRRLQAEAQRRGVDVEAAARTVLTESLPSKKSKIAEGPTKYRDLSWIAGSWTDQEAKEFEDSIAHLRRIDPEDWQ